MQCIPHKIQYFESEPKSFVVSNVNIIQCHNCFDFLPPPNNREMKMKKKKLQPEMCQHQMNYIFIVIVDRAVKKMQGT